MHNKPVALVTGANQGIGLQIAKDLVTHGFTVLVGNTWHVVSGCWRHISHFGSICTL